MKDYKNVFLVTAVGSVLALALRLWQQLAGFEADTGLAVPGHPAGIALAVALAVTAAVFALLCGLWCLFAAKLASLPRVQAVIRNWKGILVPAVLILLGLSIILSV